jgi:hypothetical protein
VLQNLHGDLARDVFVSLSSEGQPITQTINDAVRLPIDLLSKWLEVVAGPVLDLRSANLSSSQLTSLLMCLAQTPLPGVRELHLSLVGPPAAFSGGSREFQEIQHGLMYHSAQVMSDSRCCCCKAEGYSSPCKFTVGFECPICRYQFCPTVYAPLYDIKSLLCKHSCLAMTCSRMLRDLKQFCDTAPRLPSFCISCDERVCGRPDCVGVGFQCITCGKLCPKRGGGVFGEFCSFEKVLSDTLSGVPALSEYLHVLRVLGAALPFLSQLQHFGLHDVPLGFDIVPLLGHVFGGLPKSVETVSVSVYSVPGTSFSAVEKALFCRAVGRAPGLKQLNMPQWEAFVGEDTEACVESLREAAFLQVVGVSEVKDSLTAGLPPGIRFEVVEEALAAQLQASTV